MSHPNEDLLRRLYGNLAEGDHNAFVLGLGEDVYLVVPGKNRLSGFYTRATLPHLFARIAELSGGTFSPSIDDVVAGEDHGMVILTQRLTHRGRPREYKSLHLWRFRRGKPVEWWEHPRDLDEFDEIWSRAEGSSA